MTRVWHRLKWDIKEMGYREAVSYIYTVCESSGLTAEETEIILDNLIHKYLRSN